MKRVRNERGAILIMILILAGIMLTIMAALTTMISSGTVASGVQKRYRSALESALGAGDVMYQFIGTRGTPAIPLTNYALTATATCVTDKLTQNTDDWDVSCDDSMTINPAETTVPPVTYDMRFDLGNYRIYAKIADTVEGNSGPDEALEKTGVVIMNPGEIAPMPLSYLHTIEILSQHQTNPSERARLSILYEY